MERPRCAYCGKLIRPVTERVRAPGDPAGVNSFVPRADWDYCGNKQVVSREYVELLVQPDGRIRERHPDEHLESSHAWRPEADRQGKRERRLAAVTVWDGERYDAKFWPFCTGTCAGKFAQAAYRGGYRMKNKENDR